MCWMSVHGGEGNHVGITIVESMQFGAVNNSKFIASPSSSEASPVSGDLSSVLRTDADAVDGFFVAGEEWAG